MSSHRTQFACWHHLTSDLISTSLEDVDFIRFLFAGSLPHAWPPSFVAASSGPFSDLLEDVLPSIAVSGISATSHSVLPRLRICLANRVERWNSFGY